MAEVPYSGENHGKSGVIGGANYFFILHRTARLNDSGGASFRSLQ